MVLIKNMAKPTKNSEQTTIALMGQDIGYIKKSIENMEASLKSIDNNFVKKEDLKEIVTIQTDHESRIRKIETRMWVAIGALAIIQFGLNYFK